MANQLVIERIITKSVDYIYHQYRNNATKIINNKIEQEKSWCRASIGRCFKECNVKLVENSAIDYKIEYRADGSIVIAMMCEVENVNNTNTKT